MPAEPVIAPPVPTINQTDSPDQQAHTLENVQKIFDKVAPKIRGTATPEPLVPAATVPEPAKPVETPAAPVEAPAQEQTPPVKAAEEVSQEHKIPSFIEKALSTDPVKTETPESPVPDEDWPEELPTFKSSDEAKTRYKTWREKYQALKNEAKSLKERPTGADPELQQKLTFLEQKNKEMETALSRTGVEQHREFQEKILQPMHGAWNEAARIVNEAGGNAQDLAKALSLSGKPQYEALDEIFSGMPESAKIEANEAIRTFKRFDAQRRQALADAPKTAQALQKADIERQYAQIAKQKQEMGAMFDNAIAKLRDQAKVEVLQKSSDPDAKWWNEQADQVVETSKRLFLDNTDMEKVAMACALAPMVDTYRKLWMTARKQLEKSNKIINDRFGSEPSLSESGGNGNGGGSPQEDLRKPFTDVFLREFHKQQNSGAR